MMCFVIASKLKKITKMMYVLCDSVEVKKLPRGCMMCSVMRSDFTRAVLRACVRVCVCACVCVCVRVCMRVIPK